jgi:hypothetical protein
MIGNGGNNTPSVQPSRRDLCGAAFFPALKRGLFSRCPVGTKHAETLRVMKPKAQVIVPEYKQVVEI